MIELKISGATAPEFFRNAAQAFLLLANGGNNVFKTVSPDKVNEAERDAASLDVSKATGQPEIAVPLANPKATDDVDATPKKRGRKTKADAAQIDLEAVIAEKKPEVHNDPLPESMQPKSKTEAALTKTYTIDDCLDAVRQVYTNYETRVKAAGESDATAIMNGKITYAKQLVYGFDVVKVKDLKPEQFAAFVETAKGYIDGTTPLKSSE